MSTQKRRRLMVKKDRLRILTPEESDRVHGGDPRFTHLCGIGHTNSPNESRYCL